MIPDSAALSHLTVQQCVQTAFAMGGVHPRGDTSAWTDTPQGKLLRLQRGYEAALTSAEHGEQPAAAQLASHQDVLGDVWRGGGLEEKEGCPSEAG